jgi:hypothetical protein
MVYGKPLVEVWTGKNFTRSVHHFKPFASIQETPFYCVTQREFFKLLEEKGYLGQ